MKRRRASVAILAQGLVALSSAAFSAEASAEALLEASDAEVTWYQGNKKIVVDGERIIAVAEVN